MLCLKKVAGPNKSVKTCVAACVLKQCTVYNCDYYIVSVLLTDTFTGYRNNFLKLGPEIITLLGTPYDYGSVMHYGPYGFAIDPSIPTIITIDPDAEIGQRVTLSEVDIERVQIFYECLDPVISSFCYFLLLCIRYCVIA